MRNILIIFSVSCLVLFCRTSQTLVLTDSLVITDSLFSRYLSEYRKHTVYLPKGFNSNKSYPVIFSTDGGSSITDKKSVFDSLINLKIIKPVIFVASHANTKIADSTIQTTGDGKKVFLSYRNFEYTNDFSAVVKDSILANRFKNHQSYFVREFIMQVEEKYRLKKKKSNRHFYGVSNGGGFGIHLLNSDPQLIGTYLCFSVFGGGIQTNKWDSKTKYPNLYLRYGSEEPSFLKDEAAILKEKYSDSKSFIDSDEFIGRHSNQYWEKEFTKIISRLFKD